MSARMSIRVLDLGRSDYTRALALQRAMQARRKQQEIGDTLLLTEHEPVVTTGQAADFRHLLVSPDVVTAQGVPLIRVERGGDITYHGPGQLLAYPIIDLHGFGCDLRAFIRRLEECAIRLAATYGVTSARRSDAPGVYVGEGKIASVGVFVSRWVTMHGLAIVLREEGRGKRQAWGGDLLQPCGLGDTRLVSIEGLTGTAPTFEEACTRFVTVFADVFDRAMVVEGRAESVS